MADPRFYAKIDVGYLANPKLGEFIDEQPRVVLLHLAAILYCRQHLTDGRFPIRLVVRIASASYCGSECESQCDFCAAVNADLLDRIDARQGEVHDYLKHQDSAERVSARKNAGQMGAAARWSKGKNAKGNANRNADSNATSNAEERRGEDNTSAAVAAPPRPEVEHLCDLLADRIEANGSKRPTIGKGWHDAARLMLDRDERDVEEARALIDWSQGSEFWRSNILSMPKFREKYDQLRMQAESSGALRPRHLKAVGWDAPTVDQFKYHDE